VTPESKSESSQQNNADKNKHRFGPLTGCAVGCLSGDCIHCNTGRYRIQTEALKATLVKASHSHLISH